MAVSGPVDDALREKHASAGVAMAAATLAMAATSGIQALLYLSSSGIDGRTDGFFVAFALYAVFGVFSQSIRMTSANLLVGERPRLASAEYGACLALIAAPVLIATVPLAGPFAELLAPGLAPADRAVTAAALPLLGVAMVLQLWAAGGATLLAVRDRFRTVATAYIAGAVAGLAAYLIAAPLAHELVLGWSMLAMAIVTLALMLAGLRGTRAPTERATHSFAPARLASMAGLILGRTATYLAFNALYMVTLAFAGGYAEGDATVLSYAYLFASYLVAGTAFALGLSRIADMRRGALDRWRTVLVDTVPPGFRYSMLVAAPALAALVAVGAPLIGELLPSSFGPGDVDTLRSFGALLAPWTVAALLVNLLLPALLALGHGRLVNAMAPGLLALHVAATAAGGALFGVTGVVGAAFVAPLAFAAVLLSAGAREGRWTLTLALGRDAARLTALAVASFGAAISIAALVADGLAGTLLAGALGGALYVAGLRIAVPSQVRVVTAAIRPKPAAS